MSFSPCKSSRRRAIRPSRNCCTISRARPPRPTTSSWCASSRSARRDAHLIIAGMPIFSQEWWKTRDFDAPTMDGAGRLRALRGQQIRAGAVHRVRARQGLLGQGLARQCRAQQLSNACALNITASDRSPSRRSRRAPPITTRNIPRASGRPAMISRPFAKGASRRRRSTTARRRRSQGWYFNTRREQFKDPRVREAIGYCFDFEWTNKNIMYGLYKRVVSHFQNTPMAAVGAPGPDELALLEPYRDKLSPAVFGPAYLPPDSDGSGSDRALLRRADELLRAAGCKRDGGDFEAAERRARSPSSSWISRRRCSRTRRPSSRICASSASRRSRASSTPRSSRSGRTPSTTTSSPQPSAAR